MVCKDRMPAETKGYEPPPPLATKQESWCNDSDDTTAEWWIVRGYYIQHIFLGKKKQTKLKVEIKRLIIEAPGKIQGTKQTAQDNKRQTHFGESHPSIPYISVDRSFSYSTYPQQRTKGPSVSGRTQRVIDMPSPQQWNRRLAHAPASVSHNMMWQSGTGNTWSISHIFLKHNPTNWEPF